MHETTPNAIPIELLLVDDDDKDIFLTRRAFSKCGTPCQIQVAKDGEEGVTLLKREPSVRDGAATGSDHSRSQYAEDGWL